MLVVVHFYQPIEHCPKTLMNMVKTLYKDLILEGKCRAVFFNRIITSLHDMFSYIVLFLTWPHKKLKEEQRQKKNSNKITRRRRRNKHKRRRGPE